ncbi:MAG TPA: nucleoside-diphosphate sugar epimerase/dehydratase, partial [Rhizobiaceae bacterium]|nr:nucleoside-diphosphate sugar epimerase/dehydratase [Rhizobiaceae bacterium]
LRVRLLRGAAVFHDLAASLAAFLAANFVVYGPSRFGAVPGFEEKTVAFVAISALCLFLARLNRGSWRYASIPDLTAIVKAATLAVVIFTIANFMLSRAENISRMALAVTWVFMVFGLGWTRLMFRFVRDNTRFLNFSQADTRKLVLLYPYSDTTEAYIRAVRRLKTPEILVVGIIDPRENYKGREVQGRRVLGSLAELGEIVEHHRRKGREIDELVVTEPDITGARMTAILEACNNVEIDISKLPNPLGLSNQRDTDILLPKPVKLEDLLGRSEIHIDTAQIAALINNKAVLISGAGGSIGSELCRQIASFGPCRLILAELSEFNLYRIEGELTEKYPDLEIQAHVVDVRDRNRVSSLFKTCKPDVVFHAAALKHVPIVEANPIEAVKTNLLGTVNMAESSLASGSTIFIQISTDKAVNPTNVMGATKRAAEAYCQALDLAGAKTRFGTVRFGNVLGSSGSVVPRFREQIARGGPVTVTHPDITRYFMTIPEAVRLVLQASSLGLRQNADRGKILVLDMGEPVKIIDLARRMIQLAGYKPDIDIPIEITGLRPGEKLYEELVADAEQTDARTEKGFIHASARVSDKLLLSRSVAEIAKACTAEDSEQVIQLLKHMVPTYKPAGHSVEDDTDLPGEFDAAGEKAGQEG